MKQEAPSQRNLSDIQVQGNHLINPKFGCQRALSITWQSPVCQINPVTRPVKMSRYLTRRMAGAGRTSTCPLSCESPCNHLLSEVGTSSNHGHANERFPKFPSSPALIFNHLSNAAAFKHVSACQSVEQSQRIFLLRFTVRGDF